jgi:uncharacterized membrane protein
MPALPTLIAIGVAVAAAVVALHLCRVRLGGLAAGQRWALLGLRAVLFALLIAAIINPAIPRAHTSRERPVIAVALDVSASMTDLPAAVAPGRYALAREVLTSGPLADSLTEADVRWFNIGEHATAIKAPQTDPEPATGTDLRAAMSEILRRDNRMNWRACLLVSDGADDTDASAGDIAAALAAYDVPVFCLGVGSPEPTPDISLPGLVYPREVTEGEPIEVRALVAAPGFEDQALRVTLTEEGGDTIERDLPPGETERPLQVTMAAGAPGYHRYKLAAREMNGEVTPANNSRALLVRVLPRDTRLLVIEGRPRREYAFLRRLLLGFEDLETVLLLRKSRPAGFWLDADTPRAVSSPAAAGDLSRFRAVILANIEADALGRDWTAQLARFVRAGGAVAMLGGDDAFGAGGWAGTPVGELLPVRITTGEGLLDNPLRANLTATGGLGRALRETGVRGWQAMPALRGMNAVGGATSGAEVVLGGATGPIVAAGRAGAGRALAVTVADTWRWMQSPSASDSSRAAYRALWTTLIGWLVTPRADDPVTLELDRDMYQLDGRVRARVHVQDDEGRPLDGARVTVRVERSGRESTQAAEPTREPGVYLALLVADEVGLWRLTASAEREGRAIGEDARSVEVTPAVGELTRGAARPELLAAIAEAAGGVHRPIERAGELADKLPLTANEAVVTEDLHPARTAAFFVLVLIIAGADWLLRRRWAVG